MTPNVREKGGFLELKETLFFILFVSLSPLRLTKAVSNNGKSMAFGAA